MGENHITQIAGGSYIILPEDIVLLSNTIKGLISFVYPDLPIYANNPYYLVKCAIIASKNNNVDTINTTIMNLFPDKTTEYLIADSIGVCVFLLRITLIPSNSDLSFMLMHQQFFVQPAFAMTINKAQGQTLNRVDVYLQTPVFSHGQLYFVCSRITSKQNLKISTLDRHVGA
ncbi:21036_t:CDS:2, partial [Cetraspora pellucida]